MNKHTFKKNLIEGNILNGSALKKNTGFHTIPSGFPKTI